MRKNLGNKNCEFAPEHIREIVKVYEDMEAIEKGIHPDTNEEHGIASKIFDNADFGYYKVTIERPKRLKAQFTEERIAELRYEEPTLQFNRAYSVYCAIKRRCFGNLSEVPDLRRHNQ